MSRLVPEAETIHLENVNLPKITREILAMLAPAAIEKQIDLAFEPAKKIPQFPGNATAIGILIRNLVDNAIRYCKTEGQVLVRVYQQTKDVVLEVQDNGPGIPPELQSRVFERFYRVLGNKTTGSGLGLAIVQQILAMHNGRISLEPPAKGTGLIVKVYFPVIA